MALALNDRVQQSGTANTTVSFTLTGSVTGFQSFAVVGDGNTTYYSAFDGSGNWEVGLGTYSTTGPTLTRTTILSSSNSNTAVTFSGTVSIFVTYPSSKSVNLNAAGVAEIGSPISYADTGLVATFASTEAGYNQVVVQNKSTATNASSNLNVSNDASTASTGFAELGINSSTFSNGAGCFNIPGASYVASAGTDLSIGTYGAYDIHFATNSNTTDSMTIHDNGGVSLGGYGNPGIGNLAVNKIVSGVSTITASAGTTVLNAASTYYQVVVGTTTQTIRLPDATTLLNGTTFIIDNDSTGVVTVTDNASASLDVIPAGGIGYLYLTNNSTIAGSWTAHGFLPSIYNFNNLTADFGNATITNAVWNGTTLSPAYGGTGLTTFAAANSALYSTSSSALAAGTLPVAAGGTGLTSLTANYIPYGNGTSAYQSNASFTFNGTTFTAPSASLSGNLGFTGTGNRITGDFSTTTVANRVAFQTSTTNGNSAIGVMPNGTGSNSSYNAFNGSDPNNASFAGIGTIGFVDARIQSGITGTGTYLPMTFYTGGTEKVRIDTSGNVGIGGSATSPNKLDVIGNGVRSVARASTSAGEVLLEAQTSDYWSGSVFTGTSLRQSGSTATGTYAGLSNANLGSLIFQNGSAGLIATNGSSPIVFATASTEIMRITEGGNVGIGTSTVRAQEHVFGVGQTTAALTDAGARGGMLRVSDNNSAAGSGGAILFANSQGDTANSTGFAAIKGLLADGTANTIGSLAFSTRDTTASTALTERMRITTSGGISFGATGTAYGTSGQVLQSNGDAPPTWITSAGMTYPSGSGIAVVSGGTSWGTTLAAPIGAIVGTTDTQTLSNKTISADVNFITNLAASSFVVTGATGTIDGGAAQKAIPAGVVVGTTDTQTLTNKTLTDPVMIGTLIEDVFTITDAAAFEINPGNGSIQLITLTASRTPKGTSFIAGEAVTLMVNDGTAFTLTWTDATFGTGGVIWVGGVAPNLAATGFTVIELWKVSTQVYGALVGNVA